MSAVLTPPLATVPPPRRFGKYDRWLDGALYVLRQADTPGVWPFRPMIRIRLRARAYQRRLAFNGQWLEDGSFAVRASVKPSRAADQPVVQAQIQERA